MEKGLGFTDLYLDKCMENSDLKNEIRVLQEILRSYLPVLETKSANGSNNQ